MTGTDTTINDSDDSDDSDASDKTGDSRLDVRFSVFFDVSGVNIIGEIGFDKTVTGTVMVSTDFTGVVVVVSVVVVVGGVGISAGGLRDVDPGGTFVCTASDRRLCLLGFLVDLFSLVRTVDTSVCSVGIIQRLLVGSSLMSRSESGERSMAVAVMLPM